MLISSLFLAASFRSSIRALLWLPVYGPDPVELSVAVIAKLKSPPAVGVPLMVPPLARFKPAGRLPAVTTKV